MARRRCGGQHWCPKLAFWEDTALCLQGRRWLQSGRSGAGTALQAASPWRGLQADGEVAARWKDST